MTDARLPGRWVMDPVMDGLSDRAWRTLTGALMWSNEAGTDGRIPHHALRFLHPAGVNQETLVELVEAGLFEPGDGGTIVVPNWTGMGQSLAAEVEARKEGARNRKRNQRKREKEAAVTAAVTRDGDRDVGQRQDRTGQDRTGLDGEPVTSWPTAVPGEGFKEAS